MWLSWEDIFARKQDIAHHGLDIIIICSKKKALFSQLNKCHSLLQVFYDAESNATLWLMALSMVSWHRSHDWSEGLLWLLSILWFPRPILAVEKFGGQKMAKNPIFQQNIVGALDKKGHFSLLTSHFWCRCTTPWGRQGPLEDFLNTIVRQFTPIMDLIYACRQRKWGEGRWLQATIWNQYGDKLVTLKQLN